MNIRTSSSFVFVGRKKILKGVAAVNSDLNLADQVVLLNCKFVIFMMEFTSTICTYICSLEFGPNEATD